jgi:WD40 repeat protein
MTIDDGPVIYSNHLYYTLIDMTLDTGLGGVVTKNNAILNTVLLPIGLTGCKHANGRDWWLVCHEQGSNRYYKFLITPYGILGPYSQNIGKIATGSYNGQTVFSPDGKKFANYDVGDDLDIMDFDRCTGDFSNCIHDSINDSAICGGVAFSEDSKILYVSSMSYIYQYDMTSSNVLATQTIVAINDTFASPSPPFYTTFFLSQLAPDGKIYVNCGNGTLDMHVVNYPDSLGIVCAVCQHCIHLPSFNAFTIPNFPNYFLGADTTSSICDTVHLGIQNAELKMQDELNLFPNPVSRVLYSTLHQNLKLKSVKVLNVFGQEMPLNFSFIKNGEYLEINTASLSRGVYFLELLSEKEKAVKRFVKE